MLFNLAYSEESFTIKSECMSFSFNEEDLKSVKFELLRFNGTIVNDPAAVITIKHFTKVG